jgi:hypothetical protein
VKTNVCVELPTSAVVCPANNLLPNELSENPLKIPN